MDTSASSTMVGDFATIRSTTGSNHNSTTTTKFNTTNAQKGRRLDSIAARLQPAKASTSSATPLPNGTTNRKPSTNANTSTSLKQDSSVKVNCHQCLLPIKPAGDALNCKVCKKHAHLKCLTVSLPKDNQYVCPHCRKQTQQASTSSDSPTDSIPEADIEKPKTRRQALSNSTSSGTTSFSPSNQFTPTSSATNSSSSTPATTPPQPAGSSQKASVSIGSSNKYSVPPVINTDFDSDQLPAQFPTGSSFASSADEEFTMIINSENHSLTSSPSPIYTASNSARDSPMSSRYDENSMNDAEELRPILQKRSSKESNVGNKPKSNTTSTVANKRGGRQTSMKTRSGGQPSGNSYANLGKGDKRKPSVKGKGKSANAPKARRQRNSNKLTYIQSLSQSIRRESDEMIENDPDEPKTRQPDENDYIRTAIVSSADNQYVCNSPMCLICGSIGRDVEGTMLSCMSCSQSYHSYCVSMHDKLNKTILKRGWRCLQCTVCEKCGDGSDESNLLLCDECDVAFHIYCLEPKLDKIPTGSWRCHWCATCRRCNKQVQAGLDLQRLEGLCEPCHSLRKCPKCCKLYETGDLMIRCQHCFRWYHGPCEELTTEEQLENAYENAFRCSLCRPKANADYNDGMNQSVIIDNVMVNKSALEMLKCGRSASSLGNLADITGSFRSQSMDQGDPEEAILEEIDFSAAGRGGRGRVTGPGRRPPKIGIGGFVVKNRSRVTQSIDDEPQDEMDDKSNGPNKLNKRRPRKPRRHQLEDAYPISIQQAFWGLFGVDGKTVFEYQVEEPILEEFSQNVQHNKKEDKVYELSDHATEALRSQQEQDMIGDFIGDNLDIDMDSFDFSDLLGDDEDELLDDFGTGEDTQDSVQHSSQMESTEIPSHSNFMQERQRIEAAHRQMMARGLSGDAERANQQASEKWAEDEPLGDKATKAAVLHANLRYPGLKETYPTWNDRVKQIHRLWRGLRLDERKEYVDQARVNRAGRAKGPRRPRAAAGKPSGSQTPAAIKREEEQLMLIRNQISSLHDSKPSTSLLSDIKQEVNQQANGMHPSSSNMDPRSIANGILSQHPFHPKQSLQVKEQMSLAQIPLQLQHPSTSNAKPGTPTALSSSQQKVANGMIIKTQPTATNGPTTMPNIPPDIIQKYTGLQNEQNQVKQEQAILESEVGSLRKVKKNLANRKRQLNKNAPLDEGGQPIMQNLSQADQIKFDETTRQLNEKSKDADRLKRSAKELHTQLEKIKAKYCIDSITQVPPGHVMYNQSPNASTSLSALNSNSQESNGPLSVSTPMTANTPGMNSPNNRFTFSRSISIPASSSGFNSPSIFLNNGGMLSRTDSLASLASEPGSSHASLNEPTVGPRGGRGRKRRTKAEMLGGFQRSPKLGNVVFAEIKDDIDKQVYEAVDDMLIRLTAAEAAMVSPSNHSSSDLRKLLMTHAPNQQQQHPPMDEPTTPAFSFADSDIPKKKKRGANKKTVQAANETNEFDAIVERIKGTLGTLSEIPLSALNPLPSYDPALLITKDTTKLPDNNEDAPLGETKFGSVNLTFMGDFYEDFEDNCQIKYRKQDLPISCSKIYNNIIFEPLDDLWIQAEQELDEVYGEFDPGPFRYLELRGEIPRDEYDQLCYERIRERAGADPIIPMMGRWPDCESPPADPPRSAYYWREMNYPVELDLVLDHDEEMQTGEIISKIASILNPQGPDNMEGIEYEIGPAPMLSPGTDSCPDIGDNGQLVCCICNIPLDSEIFKTVTHEPFESNEHYCSQQCYDLRNVPNENWNGLLTSQEAAVTKSPLSIKIEEEEENEPPLPSPDNEGPCLNEFEHGVLIDSLRQPRELEYSVIDLPPPPRPTVEVTPGGSRAFKYRGQGWLVCDENLLSSFHQPHEDTQDAIRKHCGNLTPVMSKDNRRCAFCGEIGDGDPSVTGRLLNVDANEWVHVNCAVWSVEVHESECGGLNNVQAAIKQARSVKCCICEYSGASLKCIKLDCETYYHLPCAFKSNCTFMTDTSMVCAIHSSNVHPEVVVNELVALRRIYIEREENVLLAKIYNNSFSSDMMMRVGSLVFYNIGQLLPEQIKSFHNANFIYPVGFRVIRFFWHPGHIHERIGYECTIEDKENTPLFRIAFEGREIREVNPQLAWQRILNVIQQLREKKGDVLRFFPSQVSGDTLFGFHEIAITKMVESLPGVDQLHTYEFKHGGHPLMDVPLAVNPTGSARTEPCFRTLIKARKNNFASPQKLEERPGSSHSTGNCDRRRRRRPAATDLASLYDEATLRALKFSGISEDMITSGNSTLNSQSQIYSRYKTLKNEWRSYVALGRSGIAGFGLFAKKDIDMHQMVCEYVGEIIRSEVCEIREKKYAQKNKGIYMFRIDSEFVIDATMCGNMARYINHSCDPNCFTQIVNIDNTKKIVIFAGRPIRKNEELCYDYQFELEDTKDKIPCLCGAPNCVKWMN